MIGPRQLADVFVRVADALVDDFDLIDFLHELADDAATISGRASVGIMVADVRGDLHHLVASNHETHTLELMQLATEEGPCIECFRTGRPASHSELGTAADRWPTFGPAAVAAGLTSVDSFPMRLRDQVIGAMNIFGGDGTVIDGESARIVQALADVATIAILQERAVSRADQLASQLQHAFDSRTTIEQAKGAVSRALDVGVDQAFELIRRQARNRRVSLRTVANEVLDDRGAIDRLR